MRATYLGACAVILQGYALLYCMAPPGAACVLPMLTMPVCCRDHMYGYDDGGCCYYC